MGVISLLKRLQIVTPFNVGDEEVFLIPNLTLIVVPSASLVESVDDFLNAKGSVNSYAFPLDVPAVNA